MVRAFILACLSVIPLFSADVAKLRREFRDPPRSATQVPFWFWNGDMKPEKIVEQIRSMEEKGVHGFLIHARLGLSREAFYMSPRWLELVKVAVEEAARRQMVVYLYDEAMYPSGSAHGKVVEGRPDLASQGLKMSSSAHTGPARVKAAADAVSVSMMAGRGPKFRGPARVLRPGTEIDVPAGEWTVFTFTQTPSGGVIRGVHDGEEDNQPGAPKSADLLNVEAVKRFIEFTHEKYYEALKPHFGKTIEAIFTDEPSILGRRGARGLQPWSTGLLPRLNAAAGRDIEPFLPFLWVEEENGTEKAVREEFRRAVEHALNESYYRTLSEWCARHNVALTGHPAGGGEMSPQYWFQQPGQDVVWRWVLPGKTSLEGEQSLTGKTASSMALHLNRPVVINELYGAFGWELTMNEMKWLADWLFVRGANRLVPHAFYYSVEGARINERPPDLAWSNLWWDHYAQFTAYTNRMSWLVRGSRPVTDVAVLAPAADATWRAAKALFQSQIDFYYLDDALIDRAKLAGGRVSVGGGSYRAVVLDTLREASEATKKRIGKLLDAGVAVVALDSDPVARATAVKDEGEMIGALAKVVGRDVEASPAAADLRYSHLVKDGVHFYLVTNEGTQTLRTSLKLRQAGTPEVWDAETGGSRGAFANPLVLEPSNSVVLAFTGERKPAAPGLPQTVAALPGDGWRFTAGSVTRDPARVGLWTDTPGLEAFSGTGWYERTVRIDGGGQVVLDCGDAREWVRVEVNGKDAGVRLWPPYRFDITRLVQPGENQLRIGVTNTRSNELTKTKLPSGLIGPVRLLTSR